MENQEHQRSQSAPHTLHDRARSAAEDLHKILLLLSSGGMAVLFIAFTEETNTPPSMAEQLVGLLAISSMAVAALSGIAYRYADCRRDYLWASALEVNEKNKRSHFYKQRDRWVLIARTSSQFLITFFVVGILSAVGYIGLRLLGGGHG